MIFNKFVIIPAMVTMFDEYGNIDEKAQRQLIRFFLIKGVDGLYAGGATGEGFLMTLDERKKLIEITIEEADKKVPVICYTGSNDTKSAIELSVFAQGKGADAVSSVPPYYGNFTFEMIKNYYNKIAENINIPMLIYSSTFTKLMSIEEINTLLQTPNCMGIKYTNFNHYLMKKIKLENKEKLIFSGVDEMIGSAMISEVDGVIGSTYNIAFELFADLRDAFEKGNIKELKRLNEACVCITDVLIKNSMIASLKAILKLNGIGKGFCKEPDISLNDSKTIKLKKVLTEIKEKYNINNVELFNF